MKCRNCKKEISKGEVFCSECKKNLKDKSSTKDLEELQELIQEREKIDDLEATKDLSSVSELIREEAKPKTKVKDNSGIDEDFRDVKDSKIGTIIFVLIIGIIIGAVGFGVFKYFSKPKNSKEPTAPVVDYEKIINKYGDIVSKEAKNYIKENEEIPTWQVLSDLIEYDEYEIACQVHNVYIDGSIYLQHCKVNNKNVKYTYGTLMEDAKKGKEIKVYSNGTEYSDDEEGNELVGTIVCNTVSCEYYKAYDKYVIVKEKGAYYVYNYESNAVEFGPFKDFEILSYNKNLYGIYYKVDGKYNIYNISLGKTLKDIKGNFTFTKNYIDTGIQYKYGYLITSDNGYNFVNLKTGNISFTIKENIRSFIEDIKSGILYITVGDTNTKFKIYNSNGKLMFNGEEFIDFKIQDTTLVTFTQNGFKVYDNKLNLKVSSNTYNNILRIYDNFIVVVDKKLLKLVDYSDKEIATFTKEWDSNYKVFDKTFDYDTKNNILKLTFMTEDNKYFVYSYNFGAKLTNVEEKDKL